MEEKKQANTTGQDKIGISQEKGMWGRWLKLLIRCRLPYGWVLLYILINLFYSTAGVNETDLTAQLFAGDVSHELIVKLIAAMIINALLMSVNSFFQALTTARIDRNARRAVWNKILHLPMSFFKEEDPQETITRIVNNVTVASNTLILIVLPIGSTLYTLCLYLSYLGRYDVRLTLISLLAVPLNLLTAFLTGRFKYSISKASSNVNALLTEQISELIRNIPLAKAFANEKGEEKRGSETTDRLYKIGVKSGWLAQAITLNFNLMDLITTFIVVISGVMFVRDGSVTIKAWTAFFLFSNMISTNVRSLIMSWHNTKTIQGGVARLGFIMDQPDEEGGTRDSSALQGDICFENVSFAYNENKSVLNDFNGIFPEGRVTALLGRSGCGKTTVSNLVDRIYNPSSGKITIGDQDISEYELESYRSKFSVISQKPVFFSGTIRDNVIFGLKNKPSDEEIMSALTSVGLAVMVQKLPQGLDTQIGEHGNRLSGGQKQRIALAQMLLADAPYVILDEATASMDAVAVAELVKVLEKVLEGKTVILIAHTPSLMSLVDRVIIIENGKGAAEGTIEEVLLNNEFLKHFMAGGER